MEIVGSLFTVLRCESFKKEKLSDKTNLSLKRHSGAGCALLRMIQEKSRRIKVLAMARQSGESLLGREISCVERLICTCLSQHIISIAELSEPALSKPNKCQM